MNPTGSIDLRNCTIKLVDGTTTPNTLTIHLDDGNIQWTHKRNIVMKKDRGVLDYMKELDEQEMEVSLECRFDTLKASSGDPVTPYEFFNLTGGASGYKSTNPACQPNACDIFIYVSYTCGTVIEDEIHQFPKFAFTEIGGDYKSGTLSVKGFCNAIKPVATRSTFP